MQQSKHKTNDTYKLKFGALEIPNAACQAEYNRLMELADHINNDVLPILKQQDLHPDKVYILAMVANPSLFPGKIQAHEVKAQDAQLLHYSGRRFIVNQCRMQSRFREMNLQEHSC